MEDRGNAGGSWSRFTECVGVALWTSFLAASLETMAFFGLIDPWILGHGRMTAYGAGFFFFWLFTFTGAALTAYMLDSSHRVRRER
jgi:hypothetical protein